ncbi:TIGR02678 family protein [Mesorhizobium cantuariense]|uniref:TIGR02678 family protein n=1 Tax=Mesorhizobium cantuariense TaxID=1300275 RepID=A0ABV7MF40_9HYPH
MTATNGSNDSRGIGLLQQRFRREEFRACVRALLMTPLIGPAHEDFAVIRRQAESLREWFSRETGWILQVEREGARLYKRPGDVTDAMRGLPGYDRRRYVLLSLACAVLERADPQITLRLLGERLLELAAEPMLDFTFVLEAQHERRELVSVCRTLLSLGVLHRVAGDEETFVQAGGDQADALYDVQRRMLAGMLAAVRGPSTWSPEEAPKTLEERLRALVGEHVADSEEGRRTALRHQLARRLLDDPVVYVETLDTEARAYFFNQRGAMAARLCEAAGLVAEQRAEGLALVDEAGVLTDVAMPAEGTDAHVTLLVAEHLATGQRQRRADGAGTAPATGMREHDIADFLHEAKGRYGRYWRKSAREPGAERELATIAIDRLEKLRLAVRMAGFIQPLPALARFALGEAEIRESRGASTRAAGLRLEST